MKSWRKKALQPFWDRPRRLLVRHSSSISEVSGLLSHVIVVNVEHNMLLQFSLSRNVCSCEPILLSTAQELSDRRVLPGINRHLGTTTLPEETQDMTMLRQLRNFWIPSVTMIVLASFSDAVAQVSYKVTDLGRLHDWNLGCAMGLNNRGWTEIMEGNLVPGTQDNSSPANLLTGRMVVDIDGFKIDLGTLGGTNSWSNYDGINDRGQATGFAETDVPDPNGEDICGFGTHRTCRPFLWQNGHMRALPTLGGNNGQASAINNHGRIVGFAENGMVDSTCPPGTINNQIALPVLWEKGKAQALPTVGSDPDGVAFGINRQGQAVGYSGTCTSANYAVLWENFTATPLRDLGLPGALAIAINDNGQIVGQGVSADGTVLGAIWQNNTVTSLGLLPGDVTSFAEAINNQGQVVGSNTDSKGNWSHAFLWQNNVMIDLNTLFPASSNLYATMANEINDRGQISGMAIVLSGPQTGNIHAFLATPVYASIDTSVADVARTLPKITLPANVGKQFFLRFGPGRLGR
jgi:probable HAF family extracellular repeat protein